MEEKLFYTVVVTSALIAIIIIFFMISVIRYHRRYIYLQKERIHAQILVQEQERRRIANDLHDSVGPMLSTVKLYMNSINLNTDDDKQLLEKATLYIDETITNLREISYNLLPNSLSRNGVFIALKEYIYRVTNRSGLKVHFDPDEKTVIKADIEIHLFRILQEIIHNTIKHSHAVSLKVVIAKQADGLYIVTEDDGIGFTPDEKSTNTGGFGLKSIESRCEMINANLQIIAAAGKGCKFVIKVPD
jgi:signal transduction histidine kinase